LEGGELTSTSFAALTLFVEMDGDVSGGGEEIVVAVVVVVEDGSEEIVEVL